MFNSINSVKIKEDEYCYAMITACEEMIVCSVINAKTEKVLLTEAFIEDDVKNFIKKIYFNNKIYKAIIVDAFLQQSRQFSIDLREKLNKLEIPNFFISHENFMISSLLIAANITISFDETILIVLVGNNHNKIVACEVKFTPNGYEKVRKNEIKLEQNNDIQKIREKIMASTTPKKILAQQDHLCSKIPLKTILKSKKLILFNNCFLQFQEKFLSETCKWLFDKNYMKYYILPKYVRSFYVYGSYFQDVTKGEDNFNGKKIMFADQDDNLPLTKTEVFEKTFFSSWICFKQKDEKPGQFLKLELNKNCHRFKLTVDIDIESFETYKIEQIFLEEIQNLPKNLDTVMTTKIPVIGFFDNSSIVCICKNGSYEFVKSCNGEYGMDNFISFDEKKPKYGESALKMMTEKASFVVFDLLKILSMPADKIDINETWGFTITKDCDNPILIEFDDFKNGKRTAASPAFLMALLIKKQYLKAITAEIEEKPTEIGIWIFRDQFNEDEMKRIKEGFEEACELIKLKIYFIDC